MPAGPGPIGFLAFSGVKFLGYTAAAVVLQRAYQSTRNPWVVGLGRTGIGLVAGALLGAFGFSYPRTSRISGRIGWRLSVFLARSYRSGWGNGAC